ncbi:hypothetical protein QYF61_001114 [Mycteria americana]|uniref:Uncharacterized protein n=1 Tax=Mycteria americana TaxID=33587 RepID=A0AAN7RQE3_MYCAM|nr:hypothetical protein QYF61_001114 [Mycteria americana]
MAQVDLNSELGPCNVGTSRERCNVQMGLRLRGGPDHRSHCIVSVTGPQPRTCQGKCPVVTMVEVTTGTPESIESDDRTHFQTNLLDTWGKEQGIDWRWAALGIAPPQVLPQHGVHPTGDKSSTNFSKVVPSHGLQFFTNRSSVGSIPQETSPPRTSPK